MGLKRVSAKDLPASLRPLRLVRVVHIWKVGVLMCGQVPQGRSFVDYELAVDAPRLLVGLRLCADCVHRFHRVREPAISMRPILDRRA